MSWRVVKLGGSVLRGPGGVAEAVGIAASYRPPAVLVLSALQGVTDLLYEGLAMAEQGRNPDRSVRTVRSMHQEAVREAVKSVPARRRVMEEVDLLLGEVSDLYGEVAAGTERRRAVSDRIASCGEKLAVKTVAAALRGEGIDCSQSSPEDIGMIAKGGPDGVRVDLGRFAVSLGDSLNGDRLHLVPGFYAVNPDRSTVILGRGGSDYSASCLAHCLKAASLDIYKDVPGFLTADPREVPRARPIPRLSYIEAAELAYSGAGILHPMTVDPARAADVPIRIFSSRSGHNEQPESLIWHRRGDPGGLRGVTSTPECGTLRLIGTDVGFQPGVLGDAASALAGAQINIRSVLTSQTCITFLLAPEDVQPAAGVLAGCSPPEIVEVVPGTDTALVTVVGEGLMSEMNTVVRALEAVRRGGTTVSLVCAGASGAAMYLLVPGSCRVDAVRAIHREFFEERSEGYDQEL